ncbi:hypothetical protein ACS0TY_025901 [Phlomoides rotata]
MNDSVLTQFAVFVVLRFYKCQYVVSNIQVLKFLHFLAIGLVAEIYAVELVAEINIKKGGLFLQGKQEDLEKSLSRASQDQRRMNPRLRQGDIQVAVLEDIIQGMKVKKHQEVFYKPI